MTKRCKIVCDGWDENCKSYPCLWGNKGEFTSMFDDTSRYIVCPLKKTIVLKHQDDFKYKMRKAIEKGEGENENTSST